MDSQSFNMFQPTKITVPTPHHQFTSQLGLRVPGRVWPHPSSLEAALHLAPHQPSKMKTAKLPPLNLQPPPHPPPPPHEHLESILQPRSLQSQYPSRRLLKIDAKCPSYPQPPPPGPHLFPRRALPSPPQTSRPVASSTRGFCSACSSCSACCRASSCGPAASRATTAAPWPREAEAQRGAAPGNEPLWGSPEKRKPEEMDGLDGSRTTKSVSSFLLFFHAIRWFSPGCVHQLGHLSGC